MEVRSHLGQHEAPQTLPLVSDGARVRGIEAVDRDRSAAVLGAIRATLEEYGTEEYHRRRPSGTTACRRWLRSRLADGAADARPLTRFLPPAGRDGHAGATLEALQSRYHRPYPHMVSLTVGAPSGFSFRAGQYFTLQYGDRSRSHGVASPPAADGLEFLVGGRDGCRSPVVSGDLAVGDTLALRGPCGDLTLTPPSDRDLAFVATGVGVAPFRSMIARLFEQGLDVHRGRRRDVWLFFEAPWADDLPYREWFRILDDERSNFHFVPTCPREPTLSEWAGEAVPVQRAVGAHLDADAVAGDLGSGFEDRIRDTPSRAVDARVDPSSLELYVCGRDSAVGALVDLAERLGVPPELAQFERVD